MWVQGPILIQAAGKNCRLRHNIDAINDEFQQDMCDV